jgi:hypothetical protein
MTNFLMLCLISNFNCFETDLIALELLEILEFLTITPRKYFKKSNESGKELTFKSHRRFGDSFID